MDEQNLSPKIDRAARERDINTFIMINAKYLPEECFMELRTMLMKAPEHKFQQAITTRMKSPAVTLYWSVFAGFLAFDRFYIRDIGIGIAKLLFAPLTLGIWYLVDMFKAHKKARIKNFAAIMENLL